MNSNALIYATVEQMQSQPLHGYLVAMNRNSTFYIYQTSDADRAHHSSNLEWLKTSVRVQRVHACINDKLESKIEFFPEANPVSMWIGEFDFLLGFPREKANLFLEVWHDISVIEVEG